MISRSMKESLKNSSLIRKMFEEGNRLKKLYGGENVFDFSIGNPDLEPPEAVVNAFKEIAASEEPGTHKYMSNAGYLSTRQAVADSLSDGAFVKPAPDDIVMTAGAAGAINVALKAIIDPGDEVIVVTPYFVEYFAYIRNHGGIPKIVGCDRETFEIDFTSLAEALSVRTKAMIINTPNNPSGVVYSEDMLRRLDAFLQALDHTVYVISDEPYREVVFGDVCVPRTMDLIRNLIMCYSWSKTLALPGDRIGYLAVSPDCEDHDDMIAACITANRSLGFVNAPAIMQRVIEKSIKAKVDIESYRRRCDMLYNVITSAGYKCFKPEGALYLFPKSPIEDDKAFIAVAAEYNLLLVPGSAFGMPGHFRATFCVDERAITGSYKAFADSYRKAVGSKQNQGQINTKEQME
ncbi:MAG: pyridoxal phosphate-dependent aminotransferase [Saccharofermentanales bacterium]